MFIKVSYKECHSIFFCWDLCIKTFTNLAPTRMCWNSRTISAGKCLESEIRKKIKTAPWNNVLIPEYSLKSLHHVYLYTVCVVLLCTIHIIGLEHTGLPTKDVTSPTTLNLWKQASLNEIEPLHQIYKPCQSLLIILKT